MHFTNNKPIAIDRICQSENNGAIYASCAPGKKDPKKGYNRDLARDFDTINKHNIDVIVCLIEDFEFGHLSMEAYPQYLARYNIKVIHYPIVDHNIPTNPDTFHQLVLTVCDYFAHGHNILVHCRGGVGRTGIVCACVLINFGWDPEDAIALVRKNRPGALKNRFQHDFIRNYAYLKPRRSF